MGGLPLCLLRSQLFFYEVIVIVEGLGVSQPFLYIFSFSCAGHTACVVTTVIPHAWGMGSRSPGCQNLSVIKSWCKTEPTQSLHILKPSLEDFKT
jgi:hypothetical protein